MRQKLNAQLWLCGLLFMLTLAATANNTKPFAVIEDYIEAHKDLAVSEMHRAKVPASVKLAQGIIESNYGNSYLARNGNNHFGIKCHSMWEGPRLYRDDDTANECFRGYNNTYESYIDHSDFISRSRYAHLYKLDITDYKSWAKGLKDAGYATDPSYAKQIVFVIEKYNLQQYDLQGNSPVYAETPTDRPTPPRVIPFGQSKTDKNRGYNTEKKYTERTQRTSQNKANKRRSVLSQNKEVEQTKKTGRQYPTAFKRSRAKGDVFIYNRLKTVVTTKEMRPREIARMYGLSTQKLCKYNDFRDDQVIPSNTKVYLQQKRNKGPWNKPSHKVKIGETVKDIAQEYGIKEYQVYDRNHLTFGQQPAPGQIIYLRGQAPRRPLLISDYEVQEKYKKSPKTQKTPDVSSTKTGNTRRYDSPQGGVSTKPSSDKSSSSSSYEREEKPSFIPTDILNDKMNNTGQTNTDYNGRANSGNSTTQTRTRKVVDRNKDKVSTYSTDNVNTTSQSTTSRKVYEYEDLKTEKKYAEEKPTNNYKTNDYEYTENVITKKVLEKPVTSKKHTVKKGDTLYSLSKLYGTSVDQLRQINNLTNNIISIDQELIIPTK